jgi:ketosteroid isomerase-like protein
MSEQESMAVVRRMFEAIGKEGLGAGPRFFSDEAELVAGGRSGFPAAGTFRGRDGAERYFATLDAAIRLTHLELRSIAGHGDRVVVEGMSRSIVKHNGRPYEDEWAMFFTVADGRIVRYRHYYDTDAVNGAYHAAPTADHVVAHPDAY